MVASALAGAWQQGEAARISDSPMLSSGLDGAATHFALTGTLKNRSSQPIRGLCIWLVVNICWQYKRASYSYFDESDASRVCAVAVTEADGGFDLNVPEDGDYWIGPAPQRFQSTIHLDSYSARAFKVRLSKDHPQLDLVLQRGKFITVDLSAQSVEPNWPLQIHLQELAPGSGTVIVREVTNLPIEIGPVESGKFHVHATDAIGRSAGSQDILSGDSACVKFSERSVDVFVSTTFQRRGVHGDLKVTLFGRNARGRGYTDSLILGSWQGWATALLEPDISYQAFLVDEDGCVGLAKPRNRSESKIHFSCEMIPGVTVQLRDPSAECVVSIRQSGIHIGSLGKFEASPLYVLPDVDFVAETMRPAPRVRCAMPAQPSGASVLVGP